MIIGYKKAALSQNCIRPGLPVSIHAELNSLKRFRHVMSSKNLNNKHVDLLVIRLTKSNKLGESRPCFHCLEQLIKSNVNIRYVYYSTNDETIEREKFSTMINSSKTYVSYGHKKRLGYITNRTAASNTASNTASKTIGRII